MKFEGVFVPRSLSVLLGPDKNHRRFLDFFAFEKLATLKRGAFKSHRGIWVDPSLLAEIEYRAKSAAGKVRHPFFKGLGEDL